MNPSKPARLLLVLNLLGTLYVCAQSSQNPASVLTRLREQLGQQHKQELFASLVNLYTIAYRNRHTPADAQELGRHLDILEAFLEANCHQPGSCFEMKIDDAIYLVQKLRGEVTHDEPNDVLTTTIQSIAYKCDVNVKLFEAVTPIQQHRVIPSNILANAQFTNAVLSKRYTAYRRRVSRHRPAFDSEEPDEVEMQSNRYGHGRDGEGVRFQVIAGKPMLDSTDLDGVESSDSDAGAAADLETPFRPWQGSYRFAPAYDIYKGYSLAQQAQHIAESGLLFNCSTDEEEDTPDVKCYFLSSTKKGKDADTFQISLCVVQGDAQRDPPLQCSPFIIHVGRQTWIAVLDESTKSALGGDEIGPGEPEIDLTIYSDDPNFNSLEAFARALQSPPLSLSVRLRAHSVKASSPQRRSDIMSTKHDPWNEWLMIVVEEEPCRPVSVPVPEKWRLLNTVCVSFTTELLINKQRDPARESWHPASRPLSAKFFSQVRQSFIRQLHDVCRVQDVLGDRIACYSGAK